LDASADVAEDGGGLEEGYAVAGLGEGVGGGETAEACADDDDVEAECGTATVIEWRDLLDGTSPAICEGGWRMLCIVVSGRSSYPSNEYSRTVIFSYLYR
jgi:hypothetical protein